MIMLNVWALVDIIIEIKIMLFNTLSSFIYCC